jgi:hypothetical protein
MGFIDRGIGRATRGATFSARMRQLSPAQADSLPSHSQAMISGGFTPGFLLFGASKARAKRAAMFPSSMLPAYAVSAWKNSPAFLLREER